MEEVKFWIVGKTNPDKEGVWTFDGLFETEELAVEHCTDWYQWVGPVHLNEYVGGVHENRPWPDAYFPLAKAEYGDDYNAMMEEQSE